MKSYPDTSIYEIEQRYNRLLHYLTDYVYTVKIDNGVVTETYHGPGCYAVTGYTSEDYQAEPELWYKMVHEEDRELVLEQASRALAGKSVQPVEHRIIHSDGSIRWVKNSIVLSKDEFGRMISYDGLISDITQRKEAEELARLNQQQLIQSEKMASLGILVSGIAHEISNPNNFILLNIQLFGKVWEDVKPILAEYYQNNGDFLLAGMLYSHTHEKISKSLEGILSGSERIRKIVRSLTNFARHDTGELNQLVDVNHIVDSAITITGNLIKNSTSNFSVQYGKEIPVVKGNAQQLEQVVINLLNNACQSLEDNTKQINVTTAVDTAKSVVQIVVEDEGEGIDEDDLRYILNPFFTTKRDKGGTGLGLSISYNIVKSHGGNMKFISSKGIGTKCIVTIPVEDNKTKTE